MGECFDCWYLRTIKWYKHSICMYSITVKHSLIHQNVCTSITDVSLWNYKITQIFITIPFTEVDHQGLEEDPSQLPGYDIIHLTVEEGQSILSKSIIQKVLVQSPMMTFLSEGKTHLETKYFLGKFCIFKKFKNC